MRWSDFFRTITSEAISRETCLSQYRNVTFMPRGTGSIKQESRHLPIVGEMVFFM